MYHSSNQKLKKEMYKLFQVDSVVLCYIAYRLRPHIVHPRISSIPHIVQPSHIVFFLFITECGKKTLRLTHIVGHPTASLESTVGTTALLSKVQYTAISLPFLILRVTVLGYRQV